jgi:hypothetical protein
VIEEFVMERLNSLGWEGGDLEEVLWCDDALSIKNVEEFVHRFDYKRFLLGLFVERTRRG